MIRFEEVIQSARKTDINKIIHIPERASANSAGYDFYAPESIDIPADGISVVWTDVKACMDKNIVLMIYPRSSFGKKRVVLANGTGIIDSDYYGNPMNDGNIGIMLYNYGKEPFHIAEGERVAQGVFMKFETVDNDKAEKARTGGFGSTGK